MACPSTVQQRLCQIAKSGKCPRSCRIDCFEICISIDQGVVLVFWSYVTSFVFHWLSFLSWACICFAFLKACMIPDWKICPSRLVNCPNPCHFDKSSICAWCALCVSWSEYSPIYLRVRLGARWWQSVHVPSFVVNSKAVFDNTQHLKTCKSSFLFVASVAALSVMPWT